jgi:serine/threonine protein kinase
VDVWDIAEDKPLEPIWIGYKRGLTDKYDFGRQLGEGGFGSVRVVVQKSNGAEFACKSICKRLDVPNLPPIKQQQHLENIKREVRMRHLGFDMLRHVRKQHQQLAGACSCTSLLQSA